jgi:glycine cleavage system aminomethyltransferase T
VGADVVVDDTVVGSITSVGESLAMRAPVALGMIRREAPPGSAVTVRWPGGEAPAAIRGLPLDDFAAP